VLTGTVSVIVRLWGCNLKCKWCDERSNLKIDKSHVFSVNKIVEHIKAYDCDHVVITGGEPMIQEGIISLTKKLKETNSHVTVETNATVRKDVFCDLISMSPKLSSSVPSDINNRKAYDKRRINIKVINYYIKNYNYQMKFVVGKESDFNEIDEILSKISNYDRTKILIMPLAASRRQLFSSQKNIARMCIEKNYRYANRLQLQIWGQNKEPKNNDRIFKKIS